MDEALKADLERLAPTVDLPTARSSFDRRRRARRARRRAMIAGMAIVVVAGGLAIAVWALPGDPQPEQTVADTPTDQTQDDGESSPPSETTIADASRRWRTFTVEGVEVVVETDAETVPEQAEVVEFTTPIVDDGSGAALCFGAVRLSLPPQCSGIVAEGLDVERWWSDESGAVRWGERTVVVSWPPDEGMVSVVSQGEFEDRTEPELPSGEPTAATNAAQALLRAGITETTDAPFVLGSRHGGDKLEVRLAVADRANLAVLRAILPDPDSYRVIGEGALLHPPQEDPPPEDTPPTTALGDWCGGPVDVDDEIQFRPGAFSDTIEGTIEPGQRHRFQLEARADQQMVIDLEPPDTGPSFRLTAPNGDVMVQLASRADVILPDTGEYQICIVSTRDRPTDYLLNIAIADVAVPDDPPTDEPCSAETTGRFNHTLGTDSHSGSLLNGQQDRAFVFAAAGQLLKVWIETPAEEATITVRGPDSPDLPNGPLLSLPATDATVLDTAEGWHEICVTAFGNTDYTLWVELQDR